MGKIFFLTILAYASASAHVGASMPNLAEIMRPFSGKSEKGVVCDSLEGKVMCGYQGWFTTGSDGSPLPWTHWTRDGKIPNEKNCRVEMWPDLSEYQADERFATDLVLADGRKAEVFSSLHAKTVDRHFSWMKQYGIDGAFVQRFAADLRDPRVMLTRTTVLAHCRAAAHAHGRAYVVMYDLSGLKKGETSIVREDWLRLRKEMLIAADSQYLRHRGKPLVAIWGVGFSDDRAYTLDECDALVEFFRKDGCSVMLGVPTWWRQLRGDAVKDPRLLELVQKADVLSPWTVGRYKDTAGVDHHSREHLHGDFAWCAEKKIDYLPVVFPGFSWRNMNRDAPFNAIPRRGGAFLWEQCVAAKKQGASMLYFAMFDEVDEGTAIFKCTSDTPDTGELKFLREPSLPSDHYLKVTAAAGKLLRGEILPESTLDAALQGAK
jgi:hypothetical protein